jgi:hypothetical protein
VFCTYLAQRDARGQVDTLRTPLSEGPHLHQALTGQLRPREITITQVVSASPYAAMQNPPAIAAQSAHRRLPARVRRRYIAPLLAASVQPRIWLGSGVVTPAHFDESSNVACVVAGRRRFTLLPPEQVANLYIGPLGFAPTGTPISLVSFREPDFQRFPLFREAQAAALVAELGAGDAIYIPPLWWHHVESLERLNALVNYWWKGAPEARESLSAIRRCTGAAAGAMPAEQRAGSARLHQLRFRRKPGP